MSVKDRPRLGRGLKSLISSPVMVQSPHSAHPVHSPVNAPAEQLLDIELVNIEPNPHQPRASIDPVTLRELAASIKASGVLQPVIVRAVGNADGGGSRYQLIAGHRRTQAAKLAGLSRIPAIVRHDSTDERPAERLGEERTTITNFLRLLELNPGVQDLVARGILSAGHAKVLAGVTDPSRQDALANRAVAEGVSVRMLEEWASAPTLPTAPVEAETTEVAGHIRTLVAKSAHVVELEQELSRKLGTKLRIFPSKKKNTGKIVIQYFSLDEFDRIVEKFDK